MKEMEEEKIQNNHNRKMDFFPFSNKETERRKIKIKLSQSSSFKRESQDLFMKLLLKKKPQYF